MRVHPILLGGVTAGALDILAAFGLSAVYGGTPVRVLQGIAAGLLGRAAFSGGIPVALLGLACHFAIALGAAAVYWAASRRWTALARHPFVFGPLYGIAVHYVMTMVVLPLSRVTQRPQPAEIIVALIVIHILFVGLPIALATAQGHRSMIL